MVSRYGQMNARCKINRNRNPDMCDCEKRFRKANAKLARVIGARVIASAKVGSVSGY